MIHSTLAAGALFLVVDMIGARRGDLWLRLDRVMPSNGMIAALYFITAIAIAGMPPLSGFIGKLLILDATMPSPAASTIWTVILVTSLIAIYGLARAGTLLFWKCYQFQGPDQPDAPLDAPPGGPIPPKVEPDEQVQDLRDATAPWLAMLATALLLAGVVAMAVFADPAMRLANATAAQLHNPLGYIEAVLTVQEGTK